MNTLAPLQARKRIAYIDWLRGLACVLMFQTHCYDSWLRSAAREGAFFRGSQLLGTLPAPLFLFLAGVSLALVTEKLRRKGVPAGDIAGTAIRRGGEIFALGLLFRVQEFLLGQPGAPWTDLLRVDILNIIGLSLILMGVACRIAAAGGSLDPVRSRTRTLWTAVVCGAGIAILTPPLWTTWRPHWRAWWVESYINGVHTFDVPQTYLFPVFPWVAFAFAGLAAGTLLFSERARIKEGVAMALAGMGGGVLIALGFWLDSSPVQLYAVHDFWHSSPNFVLVRTGAVLVLFFASYAWCRWGAGEQGFSPLVELGKASLLIYWVHIEFVYGRFSILPKRSVGIAAASYGLLAIFIAMTALGAVRNRFPKWKPQIFATIRGAART
jgi:uncharacterized membrane protein